MEAAKKASNSMNMFPGDSSGKNNIVNYYWLVYIYLRHDWWESNSDVKHPTSTPQRTWQVDRRREESSLEPWKQKQQRVGGEIRRIRSTRRDACERHQVIYLETDTGDLQVWMLWLRRRLKWMKWAPCGVIEKWVSLIALRARRAAECFFFCHAYCSWSWYCKYHFFV